MKASKYWVYILLCKNDRYYTGYTTDLSRRYQEHVSGNPKCKYTRSFKPVKIAQCWEITTDKSTAMKAENYIKSLSHEKKSALIANPEVLQQIITCQLLTTEELKARECS